MSNANSGTPLNILGNIASIIGLLGISLYFTGWLYRWAYYGFYKLEVTTLDLPLESFLLVPIQVLFGNWKAIIRTVFAIILIPFLIHITLWLLTLLGNAIDKPLQNLGTSSSASTKTTRIQKVWQSFNSFTLLNFSSIRLMQSLLNEIVIVFWVLFILFHLAHDQGLADARRDAINKTSTLPVVTFITPPDQLALGKKLGNFAPPFFDPKVKDYHIIGDVGLAQEVQKKGINDLKEGRVWRLLIERNGWIYIFPTLSENPEKDEKTIVLAIPKGDSAEQLMIISPNLPEPK